MLEYKNRGLNLQMTRAGELADHPARRRAQRGPLLQALARTARSPSGRTRRPAQILNALQQIFNLIIEQMNRVASYEDVKAESNVAARTTAGRDRAVDGALAVLPRRPGDWWSRLMRHCLILVARYYTEPRTLQIRGRMGWESIADFKGAQLLGQTNVRVFPGSLEYLTRAQIMAKVAVLRLDGLDHRRAGDGRDRGRPGREDHRGLRPGRRQGQPDHQPHPRRLGDGDADARRR